MKLKRNNNKQNLPQNVIIFFCTKSKCSLRGYDREKKNNNKDCTYLILKGILNMDILKATFSGRTMRF